jgi:hypothetical protein
MVEPCSYTPSQPVELSPDGFAERGSASEDDE